MTNFDKGSIDEQREHLQNTCNIILHWAAGGAHRPPNSAEAQAFRCAQDGLKAALNELDKLLEGDPLPDQKSDLLRVLHQSVVASWMLGMSGPPLDSTHRQAILSQRRTQASKMRKPLTDRSDEFNKIIDELGKAAFSRLPRTKRRANNIAKVIEPKVRARTPKGARPLKFDAVRKRVGKLMVGWTP